MANWLAVNSMLAAASWGLWEMVASRFESLRPQAQAVSTPVQHLDSIGRAIAKDEQVTAQGIDLVAIEPGREAHQIPAGNQRVEKHTRVGRCGGWSAWDDSQDSQDGPHPIGFAVRSEADDGSGREDDLKC
jgi:hypothetical protein